MSTLKDTLNPAKKSWNPFDLLRRLYDWTLSWAEHRRNIHILGAFSTIESIFFPIPVDPLLIAMGVGKPKKALYFAAITTFGSVVGAFIGYWIGALFWEAAQSFFLSYVFSQEVFDLVVAKYNENAITAILLASFTPLPFKVFTISAGVAKIPLLTFVLSALVGRAARFFLVGGLIRVFGDSIKIFIEKYFNILTVAVCILVVLGYYLIPKVLGH